MKIACDKILPMEWFIRLKGHELNVPFEEAEALLTTVYLKVNAELLDRMPHLKIIAHFGVGYDNIDIAACHARHIVVTNTPHPVIEPTAELCMGLIYALVRRISELDRGLRDGSCKPFGLTSNLGHLVAGKTLGIIGMGNIGRALARRAAASGMLIIYHNRHQLPTEIEQTYGATYVEKDELIRKADIISLNLPLYDEVRHLISERELDMMKESAYIINTARGAHIDEAALIKALRTGRIAGAALDVFEHEPIISEELKELNNCIIVPHIGTATCETRQAMADAMVDNILAYAEGNYEAMSRVR